MLMMEMMNDGDGDDDCLLPMASKPPSDEGASFLLDADEPHDRRGSTSLISMESNSHHDFGGVGSGADVDMNESAHAPTEAGTAPAATAATGASLPCSQMQPKRPLSAYNILFQLERQRLIRQGQRDHHPDTPPVHAPYTRSEIFRLELATEEDVAERKKKRRPHRKIHAGMIGFSGLAQQVSAKWRNMDASQRALFEERAEDEKRKYAIKIQMWLKAQPDQESPQVKKRWAALRRGSLRKYIKKYPIRDSVADVAGGSHNATTPKNKKKTTRVPKSSSSNNNKTQPPQEEAAESVVPVVTPSPAPSPPQQQQQYQDSTAFPFAPFQFREAEMAEAPSVSASTASPYESTYLASHSDNPSYYLMEEYPQYDSDHMCVTTHLPFESQQQQQQQQQHYRGYDSRAVSAPALITTNTRQLPPPPVRPSFLRASSMPSSVRGQPPQHQDYFLHESQDLHEYRQRQQQQQQQRLQREKRLQRAKNLRRLYAMQMELYEEQLRLQEEYHEESFLESAPPHATTMAFRLPSTTTTRPGAPLTTATATTMMLPQPHFNDRRGSSPF